MKEEIVDLYKRNARKITDGLEIEAINKNIIILKTEQKY